MQRVSRGTRWTKKIEARVALISENPSVRIMENIENHYNMKFVLRLLGRAKRFLQKSILNHKSLQEASETAFIQAAASEPTVSAVAKDLVEAEKIRTLIVKFVACEAKEVRKAVQQSIILSSPSNPPSPGISSSFDENWKPLRGIKSTGARKGLGWLQIPTSNALCRGNAPLTVTTDLPPQAVRNGLSLQSYRWLTRSMWHSLTHLTTRHTYAAEPFPLL